MGYTKLLPLLIIIGALLLASQFFVFSPEENDMPPEDLMTSAPVDFAKAGVVTMNNPGQEVEKPYLVYEAPGAPALSKELSLDGLSVCNAIPCMLMGPTFEGLFAERRVVVEGEERGDEVLVRRIRTIGEGDHIPTHARGDIFVLWGQAAQLIRDCQVEEIMQAHSLDVYLTLKSGDRFRTVEPNIDEVFTIVREAESECGTILLATE